MAAPTHTVLTGHLLQTLTMLAETPRGKQELQAVLPQLEKMRESERGELEGKALDMARRVITWTP